MIRYTIDGNKVRKEITNDESILDEVVGISKVLLDLCIEAPDGTQNAIKNKILGILTNDKFWDMANKKQYKMLS